MMWCLWCLCWAGVVHAEASFTVGHPVYKQIQADGSAGYSDGSVIYPDSSPISTALPPLNVSQQPPIHVRLSKPVTPHRSPKVPQLIILHPKDQQSFHDGSGQVRLKFRVRPALTSRTSVSVWLDRKPVKLSVKYPLSYHSLTLPVVRGAHQLSVVLQGEVKVSETITFYVHSPRVKQPTR